MSLKNCVHGVATGRMMHEHVGYHGREVTSGRCKAVDEVVCRRRDCGGGISLI